MYHKRKIVCSQRINIFFNIFCPVERCGVTPHCLYCNSLGPDSSFQPVVKIEEEQPHMKNNLDNFCEIGNHPFRTYLKLSEKLTRSFLLFEYKWCYQFCCYISIASALSKLLQQFNFIKYIRLIHVFGFKFLNRPLLTSVNQFRVIGQFRYPLKKRKPLVS